MLKGIIGQAAFQLAVMYVLVFQGSHLFHLPPASNQMGQPSMQNTIVFNAFVWMQLFNQVPPPPPGLRVVLGFRARGAGLGVEGGTHRLAARDLADVDQPWFTLQAVRLAVACWVLLPASNTSNALHQLHRSKD